MSIRSQTEGNKPFAARAWAAISPIPVPPPVTRLTKPLRENRLLALRSCVDAIMSGVVLVVGKIYQLEMKKKGGNQPLEKLLVSISLVFDL
jgi:hypothetical protein